MSGKLTKARAWCNNEVAYIAWAADAPIDGCLGFMITRELLDANGNAADSRILPTWVAFKGQSNPDWEEQDMSVWPAQKFNWRDLTLRRSRNTLAVRPENLTVRYKIEPVGLKVGTGQRLAVSPTAQPGKYKGTPIPLYHCGAAIYTKPIRVTRDFGEITATFNNGILSTQNLRKQLKTKKGEVPSAAIVKKRINTPNDPLRAFLSGDVLPCLRELFALAQQKNGRIHAALYELSDPELIQLLKDNAARLNLILCTAGGDGKKGWDTTNAEARKALHPLLGNRMKDRMFNNSAHIGHNKFAVLVVGGKAEAVWTGSTNWTPTGLCGQTNNTVVVRNAEVANDYLKYWQRLWDDNLPVPQPISAPNNTDQGIALRKANQTVASAKLDGGQTALDAWFSPNTDKTGSSKTRTVPLDLAEVYGLMKQAKGAILFLVFNPGRTAPDGEDVNTVVSAAINFGRHDPSLLVMGAISDPTAVPGYEPPPKTPKGAPKPKQTGPSIPQAAIFTPAGLPKVLMIRAAALKDVIGDFQKELLKVGTAIIHDKVVVIDPLSPNCTVITGSHNLGFKASYANDENMLIVRGNQALAQAYAVHVMDVYEHYRFRASQEQQLRDAMLKNGGKLPKEPQKPPTGGFLDTHPDWQKPYFDGTKGQDTAYFLK